MRSSGVLGSALEPEIVSNCEGVPTMKLVAFVLTIAIASSASAQTKNLSSAVAVTAGEFIAVYSTAMVAAMRPDAKVIFGMDADTKKLEMDIFGQYSDIRYAKEELEKYWTTYSPFIAVAAKAVGMELTDDQVTVIYTHEDKELMRRENGQIVMK